MVKAYRRFRNNNNNNNKPSWSRFTLHMRNAVNSSVYVVNLDAFNSHIRQSLQCSTAKAAPRDNNTSAQPCSHRLRCCRQYHMNPKDSARPQTAKWTCKIRQWTRPSERELGWPRTPQLALYKQQSVCQSQKNRIPIIVMKKPVTTTEISPSRRRTTAASWLFSHCRRHEVLM